MIRALNLSKHFGNKVAVDDLSFEVKRGEVLGFLGPNGAGKSTTMRMVTGYLEPSAGEVFIDGINMANDPIKAKALLGYLPENAPLYSDMTVHGFLSFIAELRGIGGAAKSKAVDKAIETCFLEPVRHQGVETLSKGYRHRSCLAQSILHDPDVLILDEPTDGLDPNQKHEVRSLIRRMGESRAILFSTHILEEVDAACSRAVIIHQGKIVANGTPDELRSHGSASVAVEVSADDVEKLAGVEEWLKKCSGVLEVRGGELDPISKRWSAQVLASKGCSASVLSARLGAAIREAGMTTTKLQAEQVRLETVFRDLTIGK